MTSHSPEVIGVALPCMSQNRLWVHGNMLKHFLILCKMCDILQVSTKNSFGWYNIGPLAKIDHSAYPNNMMDVLVFFGVAHQQVVAVLVSSKNWLWWRELGRTSVLSYILWFFNNKRTQWHLFVRLWIHIQYLLEVWLWSFHGIHEKKDIEYPLKVCWTYPSNPSGGTFHLQML